MKKDLLIDKKPTPALLITGNNIKIEGKVPIIEGMRLSDELNQPQRRFLPVIDAKVYPPGVKEPLKARTMLVNKYEIVAVVPFDKE